MARLDTLRQELDLLVDEMVPPLIELAPWELVIVDDATEPFDGECTLHEGCRRV